MKVRKFPLYVFLPDFRDTLFQVDQILLLAVRPRRNLLVEAVLPRSHVALNINS